MSVTFAPSAVSLPAWHELKLRALWQWPLPALSASDRLLLRLFATAARSQVTAVWHGHYALPEYDPFILIANHNSRRETVWLTALLLLLRGGQPVHFLADWNFCLLPGVAALYRRTGTIRVGRKPARPRWLNRLKPYFVSPVPASEQAYQWLVRGHSIGIFPEGTVNRDPHRLLHGRVGAARLSLTAGVNVLPLGIRYAATRTGRIDAGSGITLHFGTPLTPPAMAAPTRRQVQDWHATLMHAVAALSGKTWIPITRHDGFSTAALCADQEAD